MPMPLSSHLGPTRHGLNARAFTLVEILIVVVILGILAAMVIPQFSNAAESSKETALKQDLFRVREQIELYRQYHSGNPPTLTDFIDQMTLASDQDGNTAAPGTSGYPYGPYLPSIPRNPFTDTVPLGAGAVGTSAWYYDETTGHIAANDSAITAPGSATRRQFHGQPDLVFSTAGMMPAVLYWRQRILRRGLDLGIRCPAARPH